MEELAFLNLVCWLIHAGCIAALVGVVVYAVVHTIKHGI